MIEIFSRLKFRTKINLGLTLIVAFTSLIIAIFVIRMSSDALIEQSRKRGEVLAGNLAMRAENPLLSVDLLNLGSMVNELKRRMMKSFTLLSWMTGTRIFDFAAPIFLSDKKLGTVRIGLSRSGIH
ncbi:PAS domain-containing protein, partial [Aduncisulcus paluster]